MPSHKTGGRGRNAIYNWRVKLGKDEVWSDAKKSDCMEWMRQNKHLGKLRLIPPNM